MKKYVLIIVIIVWIVISLESILTTNVESNKSKSYSGKFVRIEIGVYKRDTSYDIWLENYNRFFRIGANYSRCFNYDAFSSEVEPGDIITIKESRISKLTLLRKSFDITSVSKNNIQYNDVSCVNDGIDFYKSIGYLIILIITIGFVVYRVLK